MAGKDKFIHIRADNTLDEAVTASADRAFRQKQDHARYLISMALKYEQMIARCELEGAHAQASPDPQQASGRQKPVRRPQSA